MASALGHRGAHPLWASIATRLRVHKVCDAPERRLRVKARIQVHASGELDDSPTIPTGKSQVHVAIEVA